ncbi:hypothetical protein ACKFKG_30200 [Phormidesmis sp. 146-35]
MQPTIHIVDGSGGGRGKSLFTCAMAHYCQTHNYPIQLFDADDAHSYNVKKFYNDAVELVLSEIEYQDLDKVWSSVEQHLIPLVNLPAGAHQFVYDWFKSNGLLELNLTSGGGMSSEEGEPVRLIKWFLCNPSQQTLELFERSLEDYATYPEGRVIHIFVRNLHLATERQWREFGNVIETQQTGNGKPWKALFASPHAKVMDFPKFPPYERDKWDKLGWTFAQTIAASDHFHLLERQRVATFLKEFARAIDALNLWNGTLTQEETAKLTQAAQLQEKTKTRKSSTKNSASDKSEQSTKTTTDTSKTIEETNQEVAHVQS